MNPQGFAEFAAQASALGYHETLERIWPPNAVVEDHVHAFAAKAVVVRGEMWLTVGTETRHLLPGGEFELAPGVVHSERYGVEGAAYWVARRNG